MTKRVFITGATRGIGAAIAKAFAQQGHRVVVTYGHDDEAALSFHRDTGIATFKWDMGAFDTAPALVTELINAHGPFDILINNAGITKDAWLGKMEPSAWHRVIDTNLSSLFYVCQAVLPHMVNQTWGRIVNISSINALKGQKGQTNYAAAKAGMLGFTKSLAQEVAKWNITANAVAPGYTDTDMMRAVPQEILEKIKAEIPMRRFASVEDVASSVLFLASDAASYMTGQTLHVNGGHWMG